MPQMSPINWLSLFFMFCFTFIMFNVLNYFLFNSNSEKSLKLKFYKLNNCLNWKW